MRSLSRAFGATFVLAWTATAVFAADHVVLVAGKDSAALHDLANGAELARFPAPGGTSDAVALKSGMALLNHTGGNQVVLIDLKENREIGRIPSSSLGGTRPVHAYLSPIIDGRQVFVALNDGEEKNTKPGDKPQDSTALLIDVAPGSPTYLKPIGEVRLGIGHHKVAFSAKRARFAASNIADCADVISVYDYGDPADIKLIQTFTAADLGLDGSTPLKTCDASAKAGVALAPHGVGTSTLTGYVFHHLTGTGQIAAFDIDADVPTVKLIDTAGSGGAAVKDLPGGRYLVVPQRNPRELHGRGGGALCQVGQIAILDAQSLKVTSQTPVYYGDPACSASLAGSLQERVAPGYAMPSPDGKTLFLQLGTLYGPPSIKAEARFTAVFDVSNPARPQQLASIPVGGGSATRDHALTGDGKLLVVPNAVESSVTVIDVADRKALRTFASVGGANRVVTYGAGAGPSKPVGPPAPATASN